MSIEIVLSIARQLMTMAGTWLISAGLLTADQFSQLSGGALMIFSVVWSIMTHQATAVQVANLKTEVKVAKAETKAAEAGV